MTHRVQDAAGLGRADGRDPLRAWPARHRLCQCRTESGDGSVEDISIEGWNNVIGVNQTGVMLTVQHAIRAMAKNPGGPGRLDHRQFLDERAPRDGQFRRLFGVEGGGGRADQIGGGALRQQGL